MRNAQRLSKNRSIVLVRAPLDGISVKQRGRRAKRRSRRDMAGELTGRPTKKGSGEKMNWKSIAEYATQITMSNKNTDVLARDAVAKKLVPMMVVGGVLGLLATAVMIGASIAAMGASPFSPRIERMQTYAGWAVFALGAVTTWGLGVIGARMGCDVLRDPTNPDHVGLLDKPPWKIDALCQEITNSYLGETGAQNLKKHPIRAC